MLDDSQRINDLESLVAQLIRVGVVTSTNDQAKTCRVQFRDRNQIVSHDLRVLVKNSLENKDHWMPDINEQVLCLFLPIGIEQGYIVGSFYSNVTTSDVSTKDKRRVDFKDGTFIEYDRAQKKLTVDCKGDTLVKGAGTLTADITGDILVKSAANLTVDVAGDILMKSASFTVDSPQSTFTGAVNVQGALAYQSGLSGQGSASISGGDVEADGISLKDHVHTENGAGSDTSPPK